MTERYIYHAMDITFETYEKLCRVCEILAEKENITFEQAYLLFTSSTVYPLIMNGETLMWYESAEYLVDEYYRRRCRTA